MFSLIDSDVKPKKTSPRGPLFAGSQSGDQPWEWNSVSLHENIVTTSKALMWQLIKYKWNADETFTETGLSLL